MSEKNNFGKQKYENEVFKSKTDHYNHPKQRKKSKYQPYDDPSRKNTLST